MLQERGIFRTNPVEARHEVLLLKAGMASKVQLFPVGTCFNHSRIKATTESSHTQAKPVCESKPTLFCTWINSLAIRTGIPCRAAGSDITSMFILLYWDAIRRLKKKICDILLTSAEIVLMIEK